MGEGSGKAESSFNDNEKVINEFYMDWLREIKKGNFKSYLKIGRSFEKGYGFNPDMRKALNAYEKYYEAYRKLVPAKFNVIEFLIGIGDKYKSIGENLKAAEWYLKASAHVMEEFNGSLSKQQEMFKEYRLEELLKATGYHDKL